MTTRPYSLPVAGDFDDTEVCCGYYVGNMQRDARWCFSSPADWERGFFTLRARKIFYKMPVMLLTEALDSSAP